jgi:LAGLIDADG DNA endonuclease family protein
MLTGSYRWNPDCPTRTVRSGQYRGKAKQVKATQASYLAGFLDGDGSIHFQIVRQKEYRFGFYIRSSMSLSQSTAARRGLELIQLLVGGGYLRDRGTGMSDLVITSRPLLTQVLETVRPYVVFKREHVRRALDLLGQIRRGLTAEEFLDLARQVDAFSTLNYSKTKRISAADVELHLRSKGCLVPVTTSSLAQRGDGVIQQLHLTDAMTRRPLEIG